MYVGVARVGSILVEIFAEWPELTERPDFPPPLISIWINNYCQLSFFFFWRTSSHLNGKRHLINWSMSNQAVVLKTAKQTPDSRHLQVSCIRHKLISLTKEKKNSNQQRFGLCRYTYRIYHRVYPNIPQGKSGYPEISARIDQYWTSAIVNFTKSPSLGIEPNPVMSSSQAGGLRFYTYPPGHRSDFLINVNDLLLLLKQMMLKRRQVYIVKVTE